MAQMPSFMLRESFGEVDLLIYVDDLKVGEMTLVRASNNPDIAVN